jgi:hypothetical protein
MDFDSPIDELRKALARRHHATIARPITTGIFSWIAANAAPELEAVFCGRFCGEVGKVGSLA